MAKKKDTIKYGDIDSLKKRTDADIDAVFVGGKDKDGDEFFELQDTNDIDDIIDDWNEVLERGKSLKSYSIWVRFNNGDEKKLTGYKQRLKKGDKRQYIFQNYDKTIIGKAQKDIEDFFNGK